MPGKNDASIKGVDTPSASAAASPEYGVEDVASELAAVRALAAHLAAAPADATVPAVALWPLTYLLDTAIARLDVLATAEVKAASPETASPAASRVPADKLRDAEDAAIRLRDAVGAVRAIVAPVWESSAEADRARNSLQWIADKADDEATELMDALDGARR